MNVITFVVVSTSLNVVVSASVTIAIPMENSRPATSATVPNSARARKPEGANVTGVRVAKLAPAEASGNVSGNALFPL